MIRRVLALINTLFLILCLRKGPDAIPRAAAALAVAFAMWIVAGMALVILFDGFDSGDLTTGLLTATVGWSCYAALLHLYDKSSRLMPTLTAVAGCGAILTAIFTAVFIVLEPFVGAEQALRVAYPFTLWSVPVEGHIVARALGKPFIVGFVIALAVFMLQVYLHLTIDPVVTET